MKLKHLGFFAILLVLPSFASASVLDGVYNFFNTITDFLAHGLYNFFTSAFAYCLEWIGFIIIKAKIAMVLLGWDVAKKVVIDLNISQFLATQWSSLDSELMAYLTVLRIPDVVNIIVNAAITRYVLNMVGM